jgi:hypothetical protein
MVPESEIKAETHHKSGHRLLDWVVAGTALFVSLCSLGLAIHTAHSMDRLVEANSRPELVFIHGNVDPELPRYATQHVLYFAVENPGAGYARIDWARLEVQGREAANWRKALELLHADLHEQDLITTTPLNRLYVKPGSTRVVFSWPRSELNGAVWDAANRLAQRAAIKLTACYCSIFDQCWVARSDAGRPTPVKTCATADAPKLDEHGDVL